MVMGVCGGLWDVAVFWSKVWRWWVCLIGGGTFNSVIWVLVLCLVGRYCWFVGWLNFCLWLIVLGIVFLCL